VETLNRFIDFNYEFDTSKPTGVRRRFMDISLAREYLGYHPTTSLAAGLKQTWDWFCEHPDEYTRKQCYFEAAGADRMTTQRPSAKEVGV
jgi:GDP-L-fucose synthase